MSFHYEPLPFFKPAFQKFGGERLVALTRDHQDVVRWALAQGMPPILVLLPALWEVFGDRSKAGELHKLLGNIVGRFAGTEGYQVAQDAVELPPNLAEVKTAASFHKA